MDLVTLSNLEPWQWPENAGEIFLEVLKDREEDHEDRILAAEMAGETVAVNDAIVETLLAIATSDQEPEKLRGQALISLGPVLELSDLEEFEDPDGMPITEETFWTIQATLYNLFQDSQLPKFVRRCVLEAAVRVENDWLEQAVQNAYESDDEDWKLTAVFCMHYLPGFSKQILESLNSSNPLIHYHAVLAAGNWELAQAWDHVAALAESEETEKDLRLGAIEALGTIKPAKSVPILHDLISDEDEDIVEAARESLGMAEGIMDLDDDLDDEDLD